MAGRGEVRYRLTLDSKPFVDGSKQAKKEWGDFVEGLGEGAGAMGRIAQAAGPMGVALAAGIGVGVVALGALSKVLIDAGKQAVDMGGKLSDLSSKSKLSTDFLQTLQRAGSLVGVSLETATGSINAMQKALFKTPQTFEALGLSVQKLKSMAPEQSFERIGKALMDLKNPTEQAAAAMKVFGTTDVLKLFAMDLAAVSKEADALGLKMSDSMVAGLDAFGDSADTLSATWDGLLMNLAGAIASTPELRMAIEAVTKELGNLSVWVQKNEKEIQALTRQVIVPMADAMVAAAKIVGSLASAFLQLSRAAGGASGPLKAALSAVDSAMFGGAFGAVARTTAGFSGISGSGSGVTGSARVVRPGRSYDPGAEARERAAEESARRAIANNDMIRRILRERMQIEDEFRRANQAIANQTLNDMAFDQKASADAKLIEMLVKSGAFDAKGGGGVPAGMQQAAAEWARLQQEMLVEGLVNLASFTQELMGTIAMLADLPAAFGRATDSASAFQRALGGAGVLGQAGSQVGSLLFGAVGGALGSIGGSIIGAIAGVFRTPSWVKVGKEAGKVLGVSISEEMAKQIEADMKRLGITAKSAALLQLSEVMKESGKGGDAFGPQIMQLFGNVATGAIPLAEGMAEIGEVFGIVAEQALAAGDYANDMMIAMQDASQAMGNLSPEIQDFVKNQIGEGVRGLSALFKNAAESSDLTGERLNRLGVIGFAMFQKLRDSGVSAAEAWRIMGPAIDAAIEAAAKAGVTLEGAFAGLLQVRQIVLDNEALFEAVEGLDAVLKAMLTTGIYRSKEAFGAFAQEVSAMFQQIFEAGKQGGMDEATARAFALSQIASVLARLAKLAAEGKVELDAVTQALIDEADALGLLDDALDPQERMLQIQNMMLQVLVNIARVFGAVLPAEVQKYIDSLGRIPANVPGPPGGGGGGGDGTGTPGTGEGGYGKGNPGGESGMAEGGIVLPRPGGTWKRIGEGGQPEAVIPLPAGTTSIPAALGGVTVNAEFNLNGFGGSSSEAERLRRILDDNVQAIGEEVRRVVGRR